jgi:hypothetical protein
MSAMPLDPCAGDALICRQVTAMMAAERRQISRCTAAAVGTARMIRWQAQALLSQSAIAQAQAKDLGVRTLSAVAAAHAECARAAELQSEAKLTVQPLPGQ